MKSSEIFTVEYSTVQKCYHVDTLDKMLENNLHAVERNINNGYLLIGLFGSYEAASCFVGFHRESGGIIEAEKVIQAINKNEPF